MAAIGQNGVSVRVFSPPRCRWAEPRATSDGFGSVPLLNGPFGVLWLDSSLLDFWLFIKSPVFVDQAGVDFLNHVSPLARTRQSKVLFPCFAICNAINFLPATTTKIMKLIYDLIDLSND